MVDQTICLQKVIEKLYEADTRSFTSLHNWVLTINSGSIVAILAYIANVESQYSSYIIWSLISFCIGLITGMFWALVNFIIVRSIITKMTQRQIVSITEYQPLNILAWIFGVISGSCIIVGFILGLFIFKELIAIFIFILTVVICLSLLFVSMFWCRFLKFIKFIFRV